MSKSGLAAHSPESGTSTVANGAVSRVTKLAPGQQMLNMRKGAGILATSAARRAEEPMFLDRARTILPIEFQGRIIELEAHAYEDDTASYQALALVHRTDGGTKSAPLVRVHSGCVTGDIFHSLRCDCYQQLQMALETVTSSDNGIIVYLPHHEGRGIGLVNKIKAYAAQDRGMDTVDANLSIGAPIDARDYELAAKILQDLGADRIKLLTNNPAKVEALTSYGIAVDEQVAHIVRPSRYNERYLATKRERMDHKL